MRRTTQSLPRFSVASEAGRTVIALSVVLTVTAACGPQPVADAERDCLRDARLAERPRGEIGVQFGSDGSRSAGVGIEISSDYLLGRDPEEVYQSCVLRRSGQLPRRPYRPG